MQAAKKQIWFILGMSGAGKTYLARYLSRREGWSHFEMDQWVPGPLGRNGLDVYGFRSGWTAFTRNRRPERLLAQIGERYAAEGNSGAVLALPSSWILSPAHMTVLSKQATALYLVGEFGFCSRAFLERESETRRNLPLEHWSRHNADLLHALLDEDLRRWSLNAFRRDGTRRDLEELLAAAGRIPR